MNILTYFSLLFLIILIAIVENSMGHRCYVCGGDGELNCDNFDRDFSNYAKECPAKFKSCTLQTDQTNDKVIRQCAPGNLNDCKVANGVEYCFCSRNLCNKNNADLVQVKDIISDDEDDLLDNVEGSGVHKSTTVELDHKSSVDTKPTTKITTKEPNRKFETSDFGDNNKSDRSDNASNSDKTFERDNKLDHGRENSVENEINKNSSAVTIYYFNFYLILLTILATVAACNKL